MILLMFSAIYLNTYHLTVDW